MTETTLVTLVRTIGVPVRDQDEARRHLLGSGVSADEVLRWPGVPPMLAFRDQDGNGLEIVQES